MVFLGFRPRNGRSGMVAHIVKGARMRGKKSGLQVKERIFHHHRRKSDCPLSGSETSMAYTIYTSFCTYGIYPCFPKKRTHTAISLFCSVTLGSCDKPGEEGCPGSGVYSFAMGLRGVRLPSPDFRLCGPFSLGCRKRGCR